MLRRSLLVLALFVPAAVLAGDDAPDYPKMIAEWKKEKEAKRAESLEKLKPLVIELKEKLKAAIKAQSRATTKKDADAKQEATKSLEASKNAAEALQFKMEHAVFGERVSDVKKGYFGTLSEAGRLGSNANCPVFDVSQVIDAQTR